VNKVSEQFRVRFITVANTRLRRALAALATDPKTVKLELHSLAGEAGLLGLTEISSSASRCTELTRTWSVLPTGDQQLACARILRSLMGLVADLGAPAARAASTGGNGRRALVIDDSEVTADELVYALREAGFEATSSSTVEATVASVRDAPPDVVLIDANMPGIDVRSLCEQVREHARNAKLLVVSASSEAELRTVAQRVGADGYVDKLRGSAPVVARAKAAIDEQVT
jgi:two-component system, OmpR family, alkaline phosphatase synthesis response regulator PhoP